ncbi:MAG: 6-carboxytetrahydropterin synthase [Terriglobia bacterium]
MMVYLTRRYRFAAAHRLHNDSLTPEENASLYGKCNNPYGHGHNYTLEVTVAGLVNPATGMAIDIGRLDRVVQEEILDRLDHTHLNLDVEALRHTIPTTENLCVEIYKLLSRQWEQVRGEDKALLKRIRLEETASNYFEYEE